MYVGIGVFHVVGILMERAAQTADVVVRVVAYLMAVGDNALVLFRISSSLS